MAAPLSQMEVFRSGEGWYHTYRIPALVVSAKGTLLAFCEGRKNGGGDAGKIDLLLRRSFDNGKTWGAVQTVAEMGEDTIGNPAPVVDRKSGAVILVMTHNPGNISERQIENGGGARTVWITRSKDDGATWSKPEEITRDVKKPDWTWYATEFDGKDTFFGLVQGIEEELGYFSLTELQRNHGRWGLSIERDRGFRPTTLQALIDECNQRNRA